MSHGSTTAHPDRGRVPHVRRTGLSDQLADGVIELIRERGLQPGDQLEPLRGLAARFQVAVPTAREALRRLEATGAIEFRHGSGIYVGPHVGRVVMANPNSGTATRTRLLHLLDARLVIEPALARLAAAAGGNLQPLRECLDRSARFLTDHDEQLSASNLAFHREVARTAGNPVLFDVVDSLLTVHEREQRAILSLYDDRRRDHDEHLRILAAVSDSDAERAGALMADHLAEVRDVVLKRGEPEHGDPVTGSPPTGSRVTGSPVTTNPAPESETLQGGH